MLNLVFPSTISYYLSHPLGNIEIPFSVNLSKSSSNIEVLSKCSVPLRGLTDRKMSLKIKEMKVCMLGGLKKYLEEKYCD